MQNSMVEAIRKEQLAYFATHGIGLECVTLPPDSSVKLLSEVANMMSNTAQIEKLILEGEDSCRDYINSGLTINGVRIKVARLM